MTRERYVVCLTGGIGSGKSSVAGLFADRGADVIDADALAHELTVPGGAAIPAIRAAFGAGLVFADPGARKRLEAILHPMIRAESERRRAAATGAYVILMIPLLVESGDPRGRCNRVLVVDCPEEEQIRRVMLRSNLPRAEVAAIMATQATRAARLAHADDVIDNGGDPDRLPAQVEALHRRYLALAGA